MLNPIITGVSTMSAQEAFRRNMHAMTQSLQSLATGRRINRGADDAAGLITSENLRAALALMEAESRNAERADFTAAVADGALGQISDLLVEAEGLVVASAGSAGLTQTELEANQLELDSIMSSINRIASTTTFNSENLLDGSAVITAAGQSITIGAVSAGSISLAGGDLEAAQDSIQALQSQVTTQRADLGAFSAYTIGPYLMTSAIAMENLAAANSMIADTDYAWESANLVRLSVLGEVSILAMNMVNSNARRALKLLE